MKKITKWLFVISFLFVSGCTLEERAEKSDTVDYWITNISGYLTEENPSTYMISSINDYIHTITYYEESVDVISTKLEIFDLTSFEDSDDFLKIEYNGEIVEFEKLSVSVLADTEGRRYEYEETVLPERDEMEEKIEKIESF